MGGGCKSSRNSKHKQGAIEGDYAEMDLRENQGVFGNVSWQILFGNVNQIINFNCWTLVFCVRNKPVAK